MNRKRSTDQHSQSSENSHQSKHSKTHSHSPSSPSPTNSYQNSPSPSSCSSQSHPSQGQRLRESPLCSLLTAQMSLNNLNHFNRPASPLSAFHSIGFGNGNNGSSGLGSNQARSESSVVSGLGIGSGLKSFSVVQRRHNSLVGGTGIGGFPGLCEELLELDMPHFMEEEEDCFNGDFVRHSNADMEDDKLERPGNPLARLFDMQEKGRMTCA